MLKNATAEVIVRFVRDRRDEWWGPDIYIDYFGGAAPVQAWGTVAGKRFYFRARHDEWSFSIALESSVDPVDVQAPGAGFLVAERYGANDDASYLPEAEAEAIIRRCARLFHEPIRSEGTFLRQAKRAGYAARVEVSVELAVPVQSIAIDCRGPRPSGSQGRIIDVPAEGFDDWKRGAVAGVAYALATAGNPSIRVTVTRIQGLITDTNPTIVGAAAIDALCKALHIDPKNDAAAYVEQMAIDSWHQPSDAIPQW